MIMRTFLLAAIAFIAASFVALPNAEAACAGGTCFVVAAGGNSSVNTTWTLTSGGSSCACTPGTTDAVILDSLAGQLTINASLSIGTLDASGTGGSGSPYTNTLTQSGSAVLTINTAAANSLKFSTQMTYSPNTAPATTVTFANTSGTAVVTSSGKNFTGIVMNGVGGTVQQADDITINHGTAYNTAALVVTNGVWDANGHAITAASISSSNSNVRSIILGGTVTLGGVNMVTGASLWVVSTAGTFTFTKNSANFVVNPASPAIQSLNFTGGGLTYNSLTLPDNAAANTTMSMAGGNTFSSVTVGAGWNWLQTGGTTTTISAGGTFTSNGTQAHRNLIGAASVGTTTISAPAGACTMTWAGLSGFIGTGGCTFTATNSLDFGGNTGVTITAPSFNPRIIGN